MAGRGEQPFVSLLDFFQTRLPRLHHSALSLSNILQQNVLDHQIIGWIHFASEFVPQDFWHFIPEVSQAVLSGCEAVLK